MRALQHSIIVLILTLVAGCGGDSGPQTMTTSKIERYVQENSEAVAHQKQLDAMAEAQAAVEESDDL